MRPSGTTSPRPSSTCPGNSRTRCARQASSGWRFWASRGPAGCWPIWKPAGQSDTALTWEYEDGREKLLTLYDKGKKQQWYAAERLDWSQDLDPENPMVMDEARHVEAYARLLHDKFELAYPITPGLKALLESTISDRRWDMTYLGMQILIEGLALAAFQRIRDTAKNPLAAAVNAYVMQDEARHVAFGRLALRDYYPQLTETERDEREQFVVEACYHMRDRFLSEEVWETLGLPVEQCVGYVERSEMMRQFRSTLFSRIVPTIKDIGLWGPKIRRAYANMGIMGYAEVDTEELSRQDERVAEQYDARRASE